MAVLQTDNGMMDVSPGVIGLGQQFWVLAVGLEGLPLRQAPFDYAPFDKLRAGVEEGFHPVHELPMGI